MNITIKSTQQDLTGGTRALLEDKFSIIDRLTSSSATPVLLECEIEQSIAVERAGAKYRAEGTLAVNGATLRAEADGLTLEDAVDQVRDDLVRQVNSSRGRRRDLVRRGGAAIKRMLRMG